MEEQLTGSLFTIHRFFGGYTVKTVPYPLGCGAIFCFWERKDSFRRAGGGIEGGKEIAGKRGAHCVPGGTPAGRMPPQSSGGKAAGTCAPGFRIQTSAVSRRPLPIYGGASFFWENVLKKRLFTASFRAICSYRPRALCSRAVNSSFPQTTGTG